MSSAKHAWDFDAVVIGGGSAGYAAARSLVDAAKKVAVIDGAKELGGLCILRGCMPTKAMLHSAEVIHHARNAGSYGIRVSDAEPDFEAVMSRKNRLIQNFADYRRQQLEGGKFELIRQHAKFIDPHRVELTDGRVVSAGHFVIATGSKVAPTTVPGLVESGFMTSDDAMTLEKPPKSLIVLGGGAVAAEFAQFFSRMGTRVTLIQRSPHLLRDFDADAASVLRGVLEREGIRVFTEAKLVAVSKVGGLKRVTFLRNGVEESETADEIFFGLGRVPNIAGLNLEAAGIEVEEGRIRTNPEMRSSVAHIFAAGDCAGKHEIVHIGIQQGEVCAHNIAYPTQPRAMDYRLWTAVVFTEPQVAAVGLTEQRARAEGVEYLTASYPFDDHGKSMLMDANDGFVKLLAEPRTGEILGGAVTGPMGGELIHEIIACMSKRMTVRELALMPHYHPTLAEIWTYPAEELAGKVQWV